jgi:multiple sugar transport system permease protein
MWYGNTMIVLIAGIMGISPSLYEAAMVDGATGRQQFFKITLPLLKPILQFTLVTSAIGGLQMYDIPQLFNAGKPVVNFRGKNIDSTTTIVMLIKKYLIGTTKNVGRASAYSVVLFFITLGVSLIFFFATAEKKKK